MSSDISTIWKAQSITKIVAFCLRSNRHTFVRKRVQRFQVIWTSLTTDQCARIQHFKCSNHSKPHLDPIAQTAPQEYHSPASNESSDQSSFVQCLNQ